MDLVPSAGTRGCLGCLHSVPGVGQVVVHARSAHDAVIRIPICGSQTSVTRWSTFDEVGPVATGDIVTPGSTIHEVVSQLPFEDVCARPSKGPITT